MATFNTTGGTNYTLASSIGSTDTSILLSSFTEPVSGTPYTMTLINSSIVYGTISPQSDNSEFISFTGITQNVDGTALLTGVTRGLGRSYPYASSSTFKLPHAGQSIFILSDAPEVFAQYPAKANDETVGGDWTFTGNVTFSNFPVTPSNSDASTTVKGVTKLSTAPALANNPIAVGTNDPRIPIAYAVDSAGSDAYVIAPSPAITSYVAGQIFVFQAGTANTGAATLNVNGLGPKSVKRNAIVDLVTGDIVVNQIVTVVYDGTNMQLTSNILPVVLPLANGGTGGSIPYTSGVLTVTTPANASTTVIAHGLGIIPKHVKITMFDFGNSSIQSIGNYDGTTNKSIYREISGGTTLASNTSIVYAVINISVGSTTQGAITWDSTNFTITWTSASPSSMVIFWEAQTF